MVPVATAATPFEANVIAARLGAEGLLWELRGNVGGPFAIGPVQVLVAEDDADVARELLLVDEVEAVFEESDVEPARRSAIEMWVVVGAIAFSVLFTIARIAAIG
jgi:hypothetical protein